MKKENLTVHNSNVVYIGNIVKHIDRFLRNVSSAPFSSCELSPRDVHTLKRNVDRNIANLNMQAANPPIP